MAISKKGVYSPWGYQEEEDYQSSENLFDGLLDKFVAQAKYNKEDKKIHLYNKDGDEISGTSIDTTEFVVGVIESATYDPATKILTIVFSNGDVTEINLAELIDETEFGDGLKVESGLVSVLIDETSEDYISVGEDGIKVSGVDAAIKVETDRAIEAEETEKARAEAQEAILDAKIDAETNRATTAEANEKQRAQEAENALDEKIDEEIARALSAESVLRTSIETEVTRATQTEQMLDGKINSVHLELESEQARAELAEQELSTRLATEIQRSQNAEISINNRIDAEVSRATSAETAINNKIDSEISRAISAETKLREDLDEISGSTPAAVEAIKFLLGYEGNETLIKNGDYEAAFGKYNESNYEGVPSGNTIFSIGIGTSNVDRKNAIEVREDGSVYMWVEDDFVCVNDLLGQIAHEVYD